MLSAQLADVDEALLLEVCRDRWPESGTLDFKAGLPGSGEGARQEILKDICAFANANGGDIVYGIAENNGCADHLSPIDSTTDPIDAIKRRFGQTMENGLEPRVDGVQLSAVPLSQGGYALVVRVPASFQRPHRYQHQSHKRWVVRVDTHAVDLMYDQIRDAFERSATLAERARRFREERLSGILSGTTGQPLRPGPRCVVHLIPLASLAGKASVDVGSLYNNYTELLFGEWRSADRGFNLDGVVVRMMGGNETLAYLQVFRSGVIEAVRLVGYLGTEEKAIASGVLSGFVREAVLRSLKAASAWHIDGPAILAVSLVDISGYPFVFRGSHMVAMSTSADRPNLLLPETWIEHLGAVDDPEKIVRPLLDMLWQAFDLERCYFYDDGGRWKPC